MAGAGNWQSDTKGIKRLERTEMSTPARILALLLLVSVWRAGLSARVAERVEPSEEKNEIPDHRIDRTDPPEEFPDDDQEEDRPSFSFSFDPFRHFDDVFRQFRETMRRIYSDMFDRPADLGNSSTEVIEVNGKKYNVSRSVFRKVDNDSQIFVGSLSVLPSDGKKRNV